MSQMVVDAWSGDSQCFEQNCIRVMVDVFCRKVGISPRDPNNERGAFPERAFDFDIAWWRSGELLSVKKQDVIYHRAV